MAISKNRINLVKEDAKFRSQEFVLVLGGIILGTFLLFCAFAFIDVIRNLQSNNHIIEGLFQVLTALIFDAILFGTSIGLLIFSVYRLFFIKRYVEIEGGNITLKFNLFKPKVIIPLNLIENISYSNYNISITLYSKYTYCFESGNITDQTYLRLQDMLHVEAPKVRFK